MFLFKLHAMYVTEVGFINADAQVDTRDHRTDSAFVSTSQAVRRRWAQSKEVPPRKYIAGRERSPIIESSRSHRSLFGSTKQVRNTMSAVTILSGRHKRAEFECGPKNQDPFNE